MERHVLIVNERGDILWSDAGSKNLLSELGTDGSNLFDMVPPEKRSSLERTVVAVIDGQRDERIKIEMPVPMGNRAETIFWIVPMKGEEEGEDICSVIISMPMSSSTPAFQDLHNLVSSVDRAMDRVRSPVISADRFGRVLMLNQWAEELTGLSTNEALGMNITSLFKVEGRSLEELEKVLAAVLKGEARSFSVPLRTKDGGEVQETWRFSFAEIGGEGDGILMAFSYDPSQVVSRGGLQGDADENLLLLVSGSSHLLGAQDPFSTVDEEIKRLIQSQSLKFGILRIEGLERGTMTFSAGVRRDTVDGMVSSESIDLDRLSETDSPFIKELDTWARRGKMPQEVNSILHIPLGIKSGIRGFALFGTEGSVRRWSSRIPILQIFSNQIVASLRNWEMISMLTMRTMQIQSMYEISNMLSSTLDLKTLLDDVVEKGCNLAAAERCEIYGMEDSSGRMSRLVSNTGEESHFTQEELEEMISSVMDSGMGTVFGLSYPGSDGDSMSCMVLPLTIAGDTLGMMILEREPAFDDEDLRIMDPFATTTALALRNANLYEKVNNIAEELQAYNDLLAHDIANYNVPIHGYLEMLFSEPHLNEKQREYVSKALKQSENITSLVSNVRRLAEVRLNEDRTDLSPLEIVGLMEKSIESTSSYPVCQGVPIAFEDHPGEAWVVGDEGMMDIFTNLLKNACHFGGGEEVTILIREHSEAGQDHWCIEFHDRGCGVEDQWKERIFTRFWENSSDRRAEAKGLGLSVVNALCIRYGGRVWVSDRVEGDPSQGSIFSVIVPRANGP
jgi:PAS domain S-box-containing protein